EIVLKLPAKLLWVSRKLPAQQVASGATNVVSGAADAAAGAATGFFAGFRSVIASWNRKHPKRRVKGDETPAGTPEAENRAEGAGDKKPVQAVIATPVAERPVAEETKAIVAVPKKVVEEDPDEVPVRKPAAPTGPSVPFKPLPPPPTL